MFRLLPSSRLQSRPPARRSILLLTVFLPVFFSAAAYLYAGKIYVVYVMNKGRAALQAGNFEQASAAFNRVLHLQANHAQAIDALGMIYLAQGDLARAEIKYEQAIKHGLKTNRRFNHVKLGNHYLNRGVIPQAELEFKHALELSPRDPAAMLGQALALHALGRLPEAIDMYRKTLSLDPESKLAQNKLNQARQELDRGYIYYMYDRRRNPLARFPVRPLSALRFYPLAQYAAHLVGYRSEAHGAAGLEAELENYLPGNTVTLTIDSDWQRSADRALGWHKGSLIALDPRTGEILALANHPSFNPNRIDQDWDKITRNKNQPLKNRALENLYTPGSIFKIITASAALETGVNMNRIFPITCVGGTHFSGKTFWCWRRHGRVDSLQAALDTSCNLAMAELGFHLGPDHLYEYSNKFLFGSPIPFAFRSPFINLNLPIATSSAPVVSDQPFDIAERSCGLGDEITISPLHAALLACTIANQGKMMTPYFIKEIANIRGEILGQGSPRVLTSPIQADTARKIKTFMIDAVRHGIGNKAQLPSVAVAGKTGTTGDSRQGLNGWFICFAPAENPEVALAVYAEKEGTGMDVAAPIAKIFLEDFFRSRRSEVGN